MSQDKHLTLPEVQEEDTGAEVKLRPSSLAEFVGQSRLKKQLSTLIQAAKGRGTPLDHLLFYGPPGLGKTTLSQIIAKEMGTFLKTSSGPAIEHAGDLASILTGLGEGDVFFVDEIHRLGRVVEEALYPAMEDFVFDIMMGKGHGAELLRIPLQTFTVVGATTKAGALSAPMRDRFGAVFRLDFYTADELLQIVLRSAGILNIQTTPEGANAIALRSRGTPRIANRLLRRVRDFVEVHRAGVIDEQGARDGLQFMGIDENGLDDMDRATINYLCTAYSGRTAGMKAIAAGLQEDVNTLEDVVEPYLLRLGLVVRTPQGRTATAKAYNLLGLPVPRGNLIIPGAGPQQKQLDQAV